MPKSRIVIQASKVTGANLLKLQVPAVLYGSEPFTWFELDNFVVHPAHCNSNVLELACNNMFGSGAFHLRESE